MAMELCVNDKFTTDPSADDIGRAFDGAPHPKGWYLVLDDEDDGSNIEVTARPDGTYDVTADDGHREGHPARPFTADQAKAVLLKYRAREPGWREAFTWESETEEDEENRGPSRGDRPSRPPGRWRSSSPRLRWSSLRGSCSKAPTIPCATSCRSAIPNSSTSA